MLGWARTLVAPSSASARAGPGSVGVRVGVEVITSAEVGLMVGSDTGAGVAVIWRYGAAKAAPAIPATSAMPTRAATTSPG